MQYSCSPDGAGGMSGQQGGLLLILASQGLIFLIWREPILRVLRNVPNASTVRPRPVSNASPNPAPKPVSRKDHVGVPSIREDQNGDSELLRTLTIPDEESRGWYEDPLEPDRSRYFDGKSWTSRVSYGAREIERSREPIEIPSVPKVEVAKIVSQEKHSMTNIDSSDVVFQLTELSKLHERGVISEREFNAAKSLVLGLETNL